MLTAAAANQHYAMRARAVKHSVGTASRRAEARGLTRAGRAAEARGLTRVGSGAAMKRECRTAPLGPYDHHRWSAKMTGE